MRSPYSPLVVALLSFGSLPALAEPPPGAETPEKFKLIHVADLVAMQNAGKVYVFDANGPDTRAKLGIVPSAVQLSSANDYALKVLPPQKAAPLVFYCANTH
jgi:hypothetical protein